MLVILLAIVFSSFRLIVLLAGDYADDIEHQINQLIGMPVSIEKLDADIEWLSPRLKLLNVDFFDAQGKKFLHSDEINLSLNWLASLQTLRPVLGVVSLTGTDLDIQRRGDGNFVIQGFPLVASTPTSKMPLEAREFLSHSSIFIQHSQLSWLDQRSGQKLDLRQVNLAMVNNGDEHQLSINFQLPAAYGENISLRGKFQGNLTKPESLSGYLYGQLDNINMQPWFKDYGAFKNFSAAGRLTGETWLSFKNRHIERISGKINSRQLQLYIVQQQDKHQLTFEHVRSQLQWQKNAQGWQLQLDDVQIQKNNRSWDADASMGIEYQQQENQLLLSASFLRSEDVLAIGQFTSHFIAKDLKQTLEQLLPYQLQGDLSQASLSLPLNTPQQLRFNSQFKNLGFKIPQENIRIAGFDGEIHIASSSASLLLDTEAGRFSVSPLFRDAFDLTHISGRLKAFKENNSWHIQSDNLLIKTPHVTTRSRLEFIIDEQNNIFSDLHSYFEQGDLAYTSHYLPVSIMDDSLTDWLDNGIIKGHVNQGQFLLYGELNKFPFEGGEGVMQVAFDVQNASLKYMPDWPQIDDIQGQFLFTEKGMWVEHGRGHIGQADINDIKVSIDNFLQPVVKVQGNASGPADEYIQFVKNSGLNETLAYITDFKTQGNAQLDVSLSIPLDSDDKEQVKGRLRFENNDIVIPSEDYHFNKVNGQLLFTESSVSAENITASLDQYPLQLKIQDVAKGSQHYTWITSQFKSSAKTLLGPLPELRDYISGISDWDVDIKIPLNDNNKKVMVQLVSDLKNIQSSLPAPFSKQAATQKAFTLNLSVLKENNLNVSLKMADDLALSANRVKHLWLTEIISPVIKGQAFFGDDFSQDTTAKIDLEYLDLTAYMDDKGAAVDISPADIPPLNMRIAQLKLKDWGFSNIKMQTSRNKNGMYIQQLMVQAKGVDVQASGEWMSSWRQQKTQMNINLNFKNLGACLKDLGVSQAIHKAKGKAVLNWQWADAPYRFNWNLLQGEGHFKLRDGRLNDVNAGAGRLLGVLNFKTFLSLDFGSQVKDGFPFDKIVGDVKFDNGNAFIEKLKIDSKVADINIAGRIGLSDEDFDQTITVKPGVGSSLTLIGAVAGGPVTAVWVHLFQKLFGVDKIAEYKYTVTGSWDKPVVKLISAPENKDQELDDDI